MGEVAVNSPSAPTPSADTVTITTQPVDITCHIDDTAIFTVVAESDDETATLSYQWQLYDSDWLNIQGATSASYSAPTGAEMTKTYRCKVTSDKGGSATSDSAELTVTAVPIDTVTITTQPTGYDGYVDNTITLLVVAESDDVTATLTYQWQHKADFTELQWEDITGATSASYVLDISTPVDADFRCIVTSSKGGVATSNTATVLAIDRDVVVITTQPTNTTAIIGDPYTFTTTAMSNNAQAVLSYQWQYYNDANNHWYNVSGATSATFTANSPLSPGTQDFRCIVTSDKGGSATTNTCTLTVTYDTVTITEQPQSASIFINEYVLLSVTAISNTQGTTLSYQWQEEISGVWTDISDTDYHMYEVGTSNIGTQRFRVIITSDKGGTVTSNTAVVEVKDPTVLYDGDRIFITRVETGNTIDGTHFAGKTINSSNAIGFSTMLNADVFDVAETEDGLTLYSLANNGYMLTTSSNGIAYVSSGYTYYNNTASNKGMISFGNYVGYGGTNNSVVKMSDAPKYMTDSPAKSGLAFYTSENGAKTAYMRIRDDAYWYSVDFTKISALPSEWEEGSMAHPQFMPAFDGMRIYATGQAYNCYVAITDGGLELAPSSNYIVLANISNFSGYNGIIRCDDTLTLVETPISNTGWYVLPLTTNSSGEWEFTLGFAYISSGNYITLRSLQIIEVE